MTNHPSFLNNQRGLITIDFLFAFVLVMGFATILFALTITLVVVEVTQYATFTAARNYYASHINVIEQNRQAFNKYQQITGHPVFAPLYNNGWFQIDDEPFVGDATQIFPNYQQSGINPNQFWGVGTHFVAHMLDFQIPFYGSTTNMDTQDGGFRTFIASYLGREPTVNECINFNIDRWRKIRRLNVSGAAPYTSHTTDAHYAIISDNGC